MKMTGKLTLAFDITVVWKRISVWGLCPTVEAAATLYEGNVQRRYDTGMGRASGCGYDKRSAAVNTALYDLPLLQTLLLWRGFHHTYGDLYPYKSDETLYGLSRRDYGWALHADGCGMEVIEDIFKANGFREVRTFTRDGGVESYHFERVMPSSFLKLI